MNDSNNNSVNEERENLTNRYLSFSLNSEHYALPLLAVREVVAMPEVTAVPFTPPHFLGIMNLRGQVISIIDLRLKFNMKKPETNTETSVIICDLAPLCIGAVVDSVNSVLVLSSADIGGRPDIQSNRNSDYITGVCKRDDKLILLLDIAKALSVEDHMAMSKAGGTPTAKAA